MVAPLARDPQRAGLPLDIANAKPRHIAGTQPKPGEKQYDRAIAAAPRFIAVASRNQTFDLLCRQILWQFGRAPAGDPRHSLVEIGRALAVNAQIPQEGPQARYQMFSGGNAAPGDALNEIAADVLRLPPGGIIAESDQQVDGATRIVSDGRIRYAPMLPQPLLETDDECRLKRAEIWRAALTNANLLQIAAEPLGAKIRMVIAMASVRIRQRQLAKWRRNAAGVD